MSQEERGLSEGEAPVEVWLSETGWIAGRELLGYGEDEIKD
jgi:hypothetical protein